MALSRKNKRKINRLRHDADRLWAEQQVVLAKARELAGRAGNAGRDYANETIVPKVRKNYDTNIRPAFEDGVDRGRKALRGAEKVLNKTVVPALATVGGTVTGAVREIGDSKAVKNIQARADQLGQDASKKFAELQDEFAAAAKETKKVSKRKARKLEKQLRKQEKSGPGVGGWFLIGAGVAALAAVGYALWQTFRADDDLWIADEELDAPVESVEAN